jgi:hypothetical protein
MPLPSTASGWPIRTFWSFVGSAIQAGIFLAETFESIMFDLCQSFSGIGNLKLEISDPRSFREKIPA